MTETLKPLESIWQLGFWRAIAVIVNFKSYEDYGYLEPGELPKSSTYPPEGNVFNGNQ